MRPALSIVVPTHDTRALTVRCFDTLMEADADALSAERIAVDDGSSDGTAEALRARHPTVKIIRFDRAQGFTGAANAGLNAARGEILWLLNSDTEVAPRAMPRLLAAFAERPRLGIAGAELRSPDGARQWSGGRAPDARWLFALASGLASALGGLPGYRRIKPAGAGADAAVDWVSGAALALRREAWLAAGPFDARFVLYCQDVDLCLRARDLGWEVAIVSGVSVLHHEGATIGRRAGAFAGRVQPELLWLDLLRLVEKRSGPRAAERARRAMVVGAALRLLVRRLVAPLAGRRAPELWERDTRALTVARAALLGARRSA